MPAGFVEPDVELDSRCFVTANALLFCNRIDVDRVAVVVNARVRERCAELWAKRQTIHDETRRRRVLRHVRRPDRSRGARTRGAVRKERRVATLLEEVNGHV